ncbi:MAG: amino acid permease [Formosimonas sp.]
MSTQMDDDVRALEKMGYKQELERRMGGFSNFAISFSIICILAGGIGAFPMALSAGGGASVGIGWLVGAGFALVVAAAMAQIASAYPTAGALYHWGSILGGKGWGWATAWFNLLGLIFVTASVNFGVYDFFFKTLVAPLMGIDVDGLGKTEAVLFVAAITAIQAFLNHRGIKLTSMLTDLSGYLIFAVTVLMIGSLLAYSPVPLDWSRLTTFHNYTGTEGSLWPDASGAGMAFLLGLLLTTYTITGFDASAHTSEETKNAPVNVPRGILRAVFWSVLFGYIMVATFVLTMSSVDDGVKQGFGFLSALFANLPPALNAILSIGIFVANFLCGLACLTSTSRMMYAFARDGGLPASDALKAVHPTHSTPVAAIWVSAFAVFAATLYGDAYAVLATGAAVLLYISYVSPVVAGLFAEGKTWTHKGPFNLGGASKLVAVLAMIGGVVLAFVGIQPPNEKVLYLVLGLAALLLILWFAGVRQSFKGPPVVSQDLK